MLFNPFQWLIDRIIESLQFLNTGLGPLTDLIKSTPLELTTGNQIVIAAWHIMTTVADIFLGLFIIVGVIQIMYGQSVGRLGMPIGQFVGKAILTAILIHLSAFIGQTLLVLNNLLSQLVPANVMDFIQRTNNGQLLNNQQGLLVILFLTLIFFIGIFRVIFQTVKRIIRFNVLFVLSGPAYLTSFLPGTAPVFSAWVRLFVVTIFEQFVQFLTLGLGIQFLIAIQQNGFLGIVLSATMVNLTAEIPKLLERFGAAASSQGGLGNLVNTAVKVAFLF